MTRFGLPIAAMLLAIAPTLALEGRPGHARSLDRYQGGFARDTGKRWVARPENNGLEKDFYTQDDVPTAKTLRSLTT
jgi:hypothetical protein